MALGSYVAGFSNFAGSKILCNVFTILIIIISFLMNPLINRTRAAVFENGPLPCYYIDYYDNYVDISGEDNMAIPGIM